MFDKLSKIFGKDVKAEAPALTYLPKETVNFLIDYLQKYSQTVFFVTDRKFNIRYANEKFNELFGKDKAKDVNLTELTSPCVKDIPSPDSNISAPISLFVKTNRGDIHLQLTGHVYCFEENLLFFLDTKRIIHGEILKKVTKLNDEVAELERQLHIKNNEIEILKNKIEEVKVKDYLTGLYLKKYFEEIFENEIARAKRHKLPLTLVFADIDNSKFLKESYGLKVFDKIIESLSKLFISLSRKEDVISRFGDSEFAFLLPNTAMEGGMVYADKIQKTINRTLFEGSITVSITFAVIEFEKDDTLNTMFQKAYKTVREARGL